MFQFSGFASTIAGRWCNFITPGCPIRTSADQFVFADPRSFSQLITSFFASESLGIPHTLLFTSINTLRTYLCARVDVMYHYIYQLLLLLLFHYHVNELLCTTLLLKKWNWRWLIFNSASGVDNDVMSQFSISRLANCSRSYILFLSLKSDQHFLSIFFQSAN